MNIQTNLADRQAEFFADIARFYSGDEVFVPIPGFPGYFVSDLGRVLSTRKNPRFLQPQDNGTGYFQVGLYDDHGRQKWRFVHRLVLLAHIGEGPSRDHEACHSNGNRWDNRLSNLRWDYRWNNMADRLRHGTSNRKFASQHPVTATMVEDILTDDHMSVEEQVKKHGLSAGIIRNILYGQSYRHLRPDLPRRNKSTSRTIH